MPTTYTPKTIIEGDDLMLFINNKSIAYATSHTLTLTMETASINSKDHGVYSAATPQSRSWEITSENLYTDDDYETLFDAWANGTKLTVIWGKKSEADSVIVADGDAANYTPATTGTDNTYWSGNAYITNLTTNANTKEKATYSVTLTGTGAFSKAN